MTSHPRLLCGSRRSAEWLHRTTSLGKRAQQTRSACRQCPRLHFLVQFRIARAKVDLVDGKYCAQHIGALVDPKLLLTNVHGRSDDVLLVLDLDLERAQAKFTVKWLMSPSNGPLPQPEQASPKCDASTSSSVEDTPPVSIRRPTPALSDGSSQPATVSNSAMPHLPLDPEV